MSEPGPLSAEEIARLFHEAYERLAPEFGYVTREESAVPWERVPEDNRRLMIAVAEEVMAALLLAEQQTNERAGHLIRGLLDWIGVAFEDMQEPERLKCLEAPSVVVSAAGFLAALAESPRAAGQETT